jgi:hypothetical protein
MDKLAFKTLHASVRLGRVAILVDNTDKDWQQTCLRIIEFFSQLWGGAYNVIIPTDGNQIDKRFWTILETFDPDYLYRYGKSGEDVFLSKPAEYNAWLDEQVAAAKDSYTTIEAARADVDKHLRNAWIRSSFQISSELQNEIKTRLAPFWLEQYAVSPGAITAGSLNPWPLTNISKIVLNTNHPNRIAELTAPPELIPPLWLASVTGRFTSTMNQALEQAGIGRERFDFGEEKIGQLLEFCLTGAFRGPWAMRSGDNILLDLEGTTPFSLSMLQLGLYRSTLYQDWLEPLLVVVGNTFEDFCLYYSLSRLRQRVVWLLPSITEKAISNVEQKSWSRVETRYLFQLRNAGTSAQSETGTSCLTYSLSSIEVDAVIRCLSSFAADFRGKEIKRADEISSLIRFPLVAVERDNFQRDISVQLTGDVSMSPFATPKPKQFHPIHPHEHRYIAQLTVAGESPPKHAELGTRIVIDKRLTTGEARIGKYGPCFFCPNVGYFGGDIDTVLVRPQLRLPPLDVIVGDLAKNAGYESRLSDKGVYADESVVKWGSLAAIGVFLRTPPLRSLLDQYLVTTNSKDGEGDFLSSDRRRYLDFKSIKNIVGNAASSVIDLLISKQILYRGFIFGCSYCRNSDWFSIAEITQEFKCRRCGRQQTYTKQHWKMPEEPAWAYKLDSEESFTFTTDREFWKPSAPKPDVEADFFCVPDGVLTAGEAKKENSLGKSPSEENQRIKKYRHLVNRLSVRQLVFATTSTAWRKETIAAVNEAFANMASVQISFLNASHLLEG